MAYTDAISVAAKGLGAGASVYWDKDPTKYGGERAPADPPQPVSAETLRTLEVNLRSAGKDMDWALAYFRSKCNYPIDRPQDLTEQQAKKMIVSLLNRKSKEGSA